MKSFLTAVALSCAGASATAQCSTGLANGGNSCSALSYAKSTIQTFKPTCTGALNTVVATPSANGGLDDLRSSGYAVQARIRDANGVLLATSTETTDQWYPGATVTFNFACSKVALIASTTYQLEFRSIPGSNSDIELYLFCRTTSSTYADGNLIEDGVARPNFDVRGWAVNLLPATLPGSAASVTRTISPCTFFADGSNQLIADVVPGSTNGISGSTTAKVWIEGTQPADFVRRHYEITPAANATTATGRVTLFFTQADFNAFNAVSSVDLPANPNDVTGKGNLLIEKRPGTSNNSTGLPGTYTGTPVATINPPDADIVWNTALSRWEVSFNITGFSGFFVKTQSVALPLEGISITATAEGSSNRVLFRPQGTEDPGTRYAIERSSDGRDFSAIITLPATATQRHSHLDTRPLNPVSYYRVRAEDASGSQTFSNTVAVRRDAAGNITVAPVPASGTVFVTNSNAALHGTTASIYDMQGREVHRFVVSSQEDVSVRGWAAGVYTLRLADGTVLRVVKQ